MPDHIHLTTGGRISLPKVTLCAVSSVNVVATVRALETCLSQIVFADCLLLTDVEATPRHPEIRIVPIERIGSSAAYSDFMLSRLVDYIQTSHCLVVQWDGHVLNPALWQTEFLDYDYIGATWPQFHDGHDVGNGGFSLRSRKLMEACRVPEFNPIHPEDLAIGRANRRLLEARGLRFAPRELADCFAAERAGNLETAFGFHGVWNMPRAIGVNEFWDIYSNLDDRSTLKVDFFAIFKDVLRGRNKAARALRLIADTIVS